MTGSKELIIDLLEQSWNSTQDLRFHILHIIRDGTEIFSVID